MLSSPNVGERFTEFYILGAEGKAENYPKDAVASEEAKVIVDIVNHEHETTSCRVDIVISGIKNEEIGPVVLEPNEKWEEEVSFVPEVPGDNQKVEFLLYKNDETGPCLKPLHLWIDVTARS